MSNEIIAPGFESFRFPSDRDFVLWRDEAKAIASEAVIIRRQVRPDGTIATVCCSQDSMPDVCNAAVSHRGEKCSTRQPLKEHAIGP